MASVLEESMVTAMENLDSWNPLVEKKENFEKMHQNLLQMKKNFFPMAFLKRQNKGNWLIWMNIILGKISLFTPKKK